VKTSLKKDKYGAAFEQLFGNDDDSGASYMRLWHQLVSYFSWQGDVTDAEDMANEVMERLIRKVDQGAVAFNRDRVSAYALGVARNLQREHVRKKRRVVALTSDIYVAEAPQLESLEALEREALLEMLDECLAELTPREFDLVMNFYRFGRRNTEELASALGISKNYLWVKLHRIRKILQKSLERKMKGSTEVRRANS
jgi:RNA polymerase sigma factor (sigma-70 family)